MPTPPVITLVMTGSMRAPQSRLTISVARNRLAAALAELLRVAVAPDTDSADLGPALRSLATASDALAAALDPESDLGDATPQNGSHGASVARDTVTNRVTAKDIEAGRIRIPVASKELFPPVRSNLEVRVRGTLLAARWDPRVGAGRSRGGLLRFGGRGRLSKLIGVDGTLMVSVDDGGVVRLT